MWIVRLSSIPNTFYPYLIYILHLSFSLNLVYEKEQSRKPVLSFCLEVEKRIRLSDKESVFVRERERRKNANQTGPVAFIV